MFNEIKKLFGIGKEIPVQNPWVRLPVVDGTFWYKPGVYSNFRVFLPEMHLIYLLPSVKNGGFVIYDHDSTKLILQPQPQSVAIIDIIRAGNEKPNQSKSWYIDPETLSGVVVDINGDPNGHSDTLIEGVQFSENRRSLTLPDMVITMH